MRLIPISQSDSRLFQFNGGNLASIWLQYSFTIYIQVYIIILASNAKDILINIITTSKYRSWLNCMSVRGNIVYCVPGVRVSETVIICYCWSKLSKIHILAMLILQRQCHLPRLCYIYTRCMNYYIHVPRFVNRVARNKFHRVTVRVFGLKLFCN